MALTQPSYFNISIMKLMCKFSKEDYLVFTLLPAFLGVWAASLGFTLLHYQVSTASSLPPPGFRPWVGPVLLCITFGLCSANVASSESNCQIVYYYELSSVLSNFLSSLKTVRTKNWLTPAPYTKSFNIYKANRIRESSMSVLNQVSGLKTKLCFHFSWLLSWCNVNWYYK